MYAYRLVMWGQRRPGPLVGSFPTVGEARAAGEAALAATGSTGSVRVMSR